LSKTRVIVPNVSAASGITFNAIIFGIQMALCQEVLAEP